MGIYLFCIMSQGILYKYLNFNGAKASLENLTIKYSFADEVNDPMEFKISGIDETTPQFLKSYFDALGKLVNGKFIISDIDLKRICDRANEKDKQSLMNEIYNYLRQNFTFCSFSKSNSIMPMWYHYAEKYEGIVIGYPKKLFPWTFEIVYQDNPPRTDTSCIYPRNFAEQIKIVTTKASSWAYEQEVRSIRIREGSLDFPKADENNLNKIDNPCMIKEVCFGMKCSIEKRQMIYDICNKNNIKCSFYEAVWDNETYINIQPIYNVKH